MNQYNRRRRTHRRGDNNTAIIVLVILCLLILAVILYIVFSDNDNNGENDINSTPGSTQSAIGDNTNEPQTEPQTLTPTAYPKFYAQAVAETELAQFGFKYELEVNGERVSSYQSTENFNFGTGDDYTNIEGVISFRGNNFRQNAAYGTAEVTQGTLEKMWRVPTYSLKKGISSASGSWTGSGWTGQPIIVKWPQSTKQIMNMYDWAKADENLVEVIYATMDGNIYFLDLMTGQATRDKLNLNVTFKGAGSLDPRGYPLLYLGQGDGYNDYERRACAKVLSLIDGKVLYEFGYPEDSFALRDWVAYDSSALVCAEADTLIYPGENGVLYVVKLNTVYNEAAGTISVNPDNVVKLRYSSDKSNNEDYWLGYEGSCAAWQNYVFLTENSGMMHCVDLNTMSVVWVQDIWDDTNASPTFELADDGEAYLYVGNTLDNKADSNGNGPVAFFKIKASTGEIVWKIERNIYTTKDVTGGIMTSAVLGENELEGLVFFMFSSHSYGYGSSGTVVAADTKTGNIVWEKQLSTYAWSSPVAVYTSSGKGYIVQCNCGSNVYLMDGKTGEISYTFRVEEGENTSNIEASPAIYNDVIVIGTRVLGIWGIKIK